MTCESKQDYYPEYEMRERDIPCWYEISLGQNAKYLQLKIHQDFIQNSRYEIGKDTNIEVLKERFNLDEFGTDFSGDIGFEKIFKNAGKDKNGMLIYHAIIPKIKDLTNQKCNSYHGKVSVTDKTKLYPLCTSLSILTGYFDNHKIDTSASFPQLLTFHNYVERDSFSLSGNISLALHNFAKTQSQEFLDNTVTRTMKNVIEIMYGKNNIEAESRDVGIFKNKFDGAINFGCLGFNDAGIALEDDAHRDIERGHGYTFSSRNIDGTEQQIILIAGLAALNDTARKEI